MLQPLPWPDVGTKGNCHIKSQQSLGEQTSVLKLTNAQLWAVTNAQEQLLAETWETKE